MATGRGDSLLFVEEELLLKDGCLVYGHATLNKPDPVGSQKLSRVGPGWYLDGRPPRKTKCCRRKK